MTPPQRLIPKRSVPAPRLIAHYLPQFHPIPENDQWWGTGFTEWRNTSRAKPLFRGHIQPRIPADLGYYDLRLSDTREAQAGLAASQGIHGFMYYHYWFEGRRLLERPFEEVLRTGKPDFPFCLCWANETWSRRWLGEEKDILIAQRYNRDDILAHARWLARPFSDPRYIKFEGRPLFLVYRPLDIPVELGAVDVFRGELQRLGLPNPFLIAVDAHGRSIDYRALGYDHVMAFEPALGELPGALNDGRNWRRVRHNIRQRVLRGTPKLYDYTEAKYYMNRGVDFRRKIPCLMVDWDNTPRRGDNAIILTNNGPAAFSREFENKLLQWAASEPSTDLFFINAWNEWAEGNHLEPDLRYGHGYLHALKQVRNQVGHDHGWPPV